MSLLSFPDSFDRVALLKCADGQLFGEGNAQLPYPPMLMLDRIIKITKDQGEFGKGSLLAEFDIDPSLWFFDCHFSGDSVMPGCLGLDAMWQLLGFYLAWRGNLGRGRALGMGKVKFTGQVLPTHKKVTYQIDVKRVVEGRLAVAIADGKMYVDDELIYVAKDLRCGLFVQQATCTAATAI